MTKHPARRRAQRGVALIEVLVTLVILLIGLLGLAGVAARANVNEFESYQRVQALLLAQDMADRLNANRQVADCYSAGTAGVRLGSGITYSLPPGCVAGSTADTDLQQWDGMLKGSAEVSGTSKVGAMIGAIGCIDKIDTVNRVYMISVSWQGMANTIAPTVVAGATPCGQGLYSDERMHRLVTTTVQIPVL